MLNPTKEQLADKQCIKENAPEGATHFLYENEASSARNKASNALTKIRTTFEQEGAVTHHNNPHNNPPLVLRGVITSFCWR